MPDDPDIDAIRAYVERFPEQAIQPIPGSPFVPTHEIWCAMKYMPIFGRTEAEVVDSYDRLYAAARRAVETGVPITDWEQFRRIDGAPRSKPRARLRLVQAPDTAPPTQS